MSTVKTINIQHPSATSPNITLDASTIMNLGSWQIWTPVITQGVVVSNTNSRSRYIQIGKLIICYCTLTITGSGTSGQTISLSLPMPGASSASGFGSWRHFDAGNTNYAGTAEVTSTTSVVFYKNGDGNPHGLGSGQLTANDVWQTQIMYEVA